MRDLLVRFAGLSGRDGAWTARCPAHEDHRASLSIGTGADGRVLAFYNMEPHWVSGSTGWSEYSAVLDLPAEAATIMFGGSLVNTGSVWLDDASIEFVGGDVPVTHISAPRGGYVAVVDSSGLAKTLQNPGFEKTRTLRQGE